MKQNLTKFFNLIKKDKQAKTLTIIGVLMLFIFTIGYSLSVFTGGKNATLANIKVNDLSFNITTNSGESNDRVLHLQAGKTELFKSTITNLNKMNTKYELIYKVCTDAKCTSYLDTLPSGVKVGLVSTTKSNVSGLLDANAFSEVDILTENNTSTDYYILLDLQAGYIWNDLALLNQFNDFSKYVSIMAYVDGVEVAEYPDSCNYTAEIIGYKNNKQITLEEAGGTCANNKWKIFYVGMPDKIQIKFKKKPTASDYLASLDKESNGLEIDDTDDQNLRYVGANPKNYINFNNETWRIIGVFNVKDSTGKIERKIKLVRNESLGNYSWDATGNDNYGFNNWTEADLKNELNGDYLNTTLTANMNNWYNSYWDSSTNKPVFRQTGEFNYTNVIKSNYQNMISETVWNIGGNSYNNPSSAPYGLPLLDQYNKERGTITYQNSRPTEWTGKVGLIYASDYGYASTNRECRENIRAGIVYDSTKDQNDYTNTKCKLDNWLQKPSWYWTLSPYSGNIGNVFLVNNKDGAVYDTPAAISYGVWPAVFLKSDILIAGGTGIESEPYQIGIMSDFANDSWSTIAENVKNGNSSIYKIGDEKEVEIGGNSYTLRVANSSTPSECKGANFSQTACGFVVEFVDIVETRAMNSSATNVGGWPATAMRTYANGEFFNKLPSDLKKVIVDTTVISGHGSTSGENNFTSTDKIYLLSAKEVWNGSSYDSAINNTRQLDYYSLKGVNTSSSFAGAIKKYNNSNVDWWLRTTNSNASSFYRLVLSTGVMDFGSPTTGSNGFAPAFRIG